MFPQPSKEKIIKLERLQSWFRVTARYIDLQPFYFDNYQAAITFCERRASESENVQIINAVDGEDK